MRKTIVADTSTLILFQKIGRLKLLQELFGRIHITQIVAEEFGKPLPNWIDKVTVNLESDNELLKSLDSGEASSIQLAQE